MVSKFAISKATGFSVQLMYVTDAGGQSSMFKGP